MKKAAIVFFFLLLSMTNAFAWSDNICQSEGWSARYNMETSGGPATILVENLADQAAFKITVMLYFYDYFGHIIGTFKYLEPGPIYKQFPFIARVPDKTSKISATVYNSWEYGQ